MHSLMNSSMKITDVNMETEVPELLLPPNHVDSNGRHLPKHSPMKITDVDMKIEALTNYINLRRAGGEGGSMNVGNKKTKKKTFRVPQDELDEILSYQAAPAPAWQTVARRYPWVVAEMEKIKVGFLAGQERMRRQYETLGYATFEAEVTDDEQEEDAAVMTPCEENDDAAATSSPWIIPRGRGRRRFRPGVVKQASGVKKIT
ncbi:hypothetical protein ACQJBY_051854 [Aegilops geniculata]